MSQINKFINVNQNNTNKSNVLRKLNNENSLNICKIIGKYKTIYIYNNL